MAKFCSDGDVAGATAILEQMKQEKMPVNEYVFHSLIHGHARAGDMDSARSAMRIMEESGLVVGSKARLALLLGMVRADADWSEVRLPLKVLKKKIGLILR